MFRARNAFGRSSNSPGRKTPRGIVAGFRGLFAFRSDGPAIAFAPLVAPNGWKSYAIIRREKRRDFYLPGNGRATDGQRQGKRR